MKWDRFCIGDKVIFIGDPDRMIDKDGNILACDLVYGEKYEVTNIFFWGSNGAD